MAQNNDIICILCPLACQITVTLDAQGNISDVTNYSCKQGQEYAIAECKFPGRILTTTVLTKGRSHRLLPVRTSKPVPKDHLMEVMRSLSQIKVKPPIKMKQVIVSNVAQTGVNVVSSDELPMTTLE
jgi:CxxC motif-containing protein